MILCDKDLKKLIDEGTLIIEPLEESQIGPTSVDLCLGYILIKYESNHIELGKEVSKVKEIIIDTKNGYSLQPGEFVLGCTRERIRMPNGYQGFIETKGNIARAGIQVHNGNGHVDPGTDHIITLEISNVNSIPIVLYPEVRICQLFVHLLSDECDKPYNGKYFGQTKPTIYKPD